ncbi:olfactory receptor 2AT4-like [Rhinatrema bivittatum]|uniref:olfactory receptor 2AT4-like n=1 Tax=Rhinatrema bivittatum TaxID=194408 RepID=UPI0011295B59|nr:olfactory receptor 2AT4-like [Rhinatrema bivittatum]
MEEYNHSRVNTDFILVGFTSLQNFQILLFCVFLMFYLIILTSNLMILVAVLVDRNLHKPMYFFLTNLSVLDILCTTTTMPKMLAMYLMNAKTISFFGCFIQMYFFHSLTVTESLLLVVMAYDRYVAICSPLHYTTKMTKRVNIQLAAGAWMTALLIPVPAVIQTSQLSFCGPNMVYHCFCDHLAVLQTSCSDITSQTVLGFSIAMAVSGVPLMLVIFSYANIIFSILKINSKEGRHKAFSTCTSHLIVVFTFYTSIAVAYISYRTDIPLDIHVLGNVVFAILTPMVNPLIYTLRNREVKEAIAKCIHLKLSPLFENM